MQAGQKMQVWGRVAVGLVTVRGGPRRLSKRGLTKRGGSQESAGDGAPAGGSAEERPDSWGDTSLYGQ